MKKAIILLLALVSLNGSLQAAVKIYVSPQGNDNQTGTREAPLATLQGARDRARFIRDTQQVKDSIIVEILPGIYYQSQPLELTEIDGAGAEAPLIFRGDCADRPIICGGRPLPRFEQVSSNLWRTHIADGSRFEQLYINGGRRTLARTPNAGEMARIRDMKELHAAKEMNGSMPCIKKVLLGKDDFEQFRTLDDEDLKDALVCFHVKWDTDRERVAHLSMKDTTLFTVGFHSRSSPIGIDSRFYIENHPKALDAPGEWYLAKDNYLYYIPLPGETIDAAEGFYPVSDGFIQIQGKPSKPASGISFENIRFEVAGYIAPWNEDNGPQTASRISAEITLNDADHIRMTNCDVAHTGKHAVRIDKRCTWSEISHCHIYDLGGSAFQIGMSGDSIDYSNYDENFAAPTHHITIDNNILQHGGRIFAPASAIVIYNASDCHISHNDIGDFYYTGISVGWVWGYGPSASKRNIIEYNHIHHLGWGDLSDMGGVYTLGASEGTVVRNNVIHHIYSMYYGGWGLYTDEGSKGIIMENNLVYRCKDSGFHQHYGKENIIRNNIFANNLISQLQLTRIEPHLQLSFIHNIVYFEKGDLIEGLGSAEMMKDTRWVRTNLVMDYNCYWNPNLKGVSSDSFSLTEWRNAGCDKHSLEADPMFVNPSRNDFRFKQAKVARKIGFKPFDTSTVGVYGDDCWKELAQLPDEDLQRFEQIMSK